MRPHSLHVLGPCEETRPALPIWRDRELAHQIVPISVTNPRHTPPIHDAEDSNSLCKFVFKMPENFIPRMLRTGDKSVPHPPFSVRPSLCSCPATTSAQSAPKSPLYKKSFIQPLHVGIFISAYEKAPIPCGLGLFSGAVMENEKTKGWRNSIACAKKDVKQKDQ